MKNLGRDAIDIVTGFKGVVTGKVQYLTGCAQYYISPPCGENGCYVSGEWLDETRLEFGDQKIDYPVRNVDSTVGAGAAAPRY